MFDQSVPDFVPTRRAMEHALAALGGVVERVQRAMDAGALEPGDAFTVAAALWACDHGLASLEAKTQLFRSDVFDWDRIARVALDALIDGLVRRS